MDLERRFSKLITPFSSRYSDLSMTYMEDSAGDFESLLQGL